MWRFGHLPCREVDFVLHGLVIGLHAGHSLLIVVFLFVTGVFKQMYARRTSSAPPPLAVIAPPNVSQPPATRYFSRYVSLIRPHVSLCISHADPVVRRCKKQYRVCKFACGCSVDVDESVSWCRLAVERGEPCDDVDGAYRLVFRSCAFL